MMYVRIDRSWLFSSTAQRTYLVCAVLDLALIATRIGVSLATSIAGVQTLPHGLRLVLLALFFPEAAGTGILFVGMTYCWLGFGGSYTRKLFWIVLIQFFLVTGLVYYFTAYRKLARRESKEVSGLVPT